MANIDRNEFLRIKTILFESWENMHQVIWALAAFDNDDLFPKDRWTEDWKEIIDFCRDNDVTDNQGLLAAIDRWAEELGI